MKPNEIVASGFDGLLRTNNWKQEDEDEDENDDSDNDDDSQDSESPV
jgi:hypothetical protein